MVVKIWTSRKTLMQCDENPTPRKGYDSGDNTSSLLQCDENPTPRKGYDSGDNTSSLHFVQSLKMAQWLLRKESFNFHTHKTLTLNTYKP